MTVKRLTRVCLALAAAALLGLGAAPARAEIQPSSDVLMPFFEVDLRGIPEVSRTALFALCNDSDDPVDTLITIRSNWGIPVLEVPLTLQGDQVYTANLRDWLVAGRLPATTLSAEALAHLQAALSGQPSPRDQKYYSTQVAPDLAVGAVSFRALGPGHRDVLWGDSFVVDPKIGFAEGETLVNVDPAVECLPECKRHGIRFLEGGVFDGGTELMIWTKRRGVPSSLSELPANQQIAAEFKIYDESGRLIDTVHLSLLPVQRLKIADLGLSEPFGWIDIVTDTASYITGHFSASDRYSSALHAWCLPEELEPPGPGIRIEKLTNGAAAELPTGPKVPAGGTIHWTYIVTNTGDVDLTKILVADSDDVPVICPQTTLAVGESMTCEASGIAAACQHANTATATGTPPTGGTVSDSDISHYYGEQQGSLSLKAMINGDDANTPPGPELVSGVAASWTYTVTNTGSFKLSGITVTDQHGSPVTCPKASLDPGESMTCTASATAIDGPQAFMATAEGKIDCGPPVSASDPTHYKGRPPQVSISLKKYTNGQDADTPQGPRLLKGSNVFWTYVVTNTGGVVLSGVTVTDDRGLAVSCPKTVLQPAESMTCTASGTAAMGQYRNVGTATGTSPGGRDVSSHDPSHYFGWWPAIGLEKLVNGFEADTPPYPEVAVGNAVLWTYIVTNIGDTALSSVNVVDDRGVVVTCPKTALQPGESMTCTAGGTAVAGQYCNVGTASGSAEGENAQASDPACYTGVVPRITIEKRVNGEDADLPPGPVVLKGTAVTWTYLVTNTGDTALTNIRVTDDKGVAVSCPKTTLQPAESMTCTGSGTATQGQYCNLGMATGTPATGPPAVTATDPACHLGVWPEIKIEKLTNGEDADTPTGPTIAVGDPVLWTYVVTNTGDMQLSSVQVIDSRGVTVTCPKTVLAPSESMTCTASGTATAGQYANIGTASGLPAGFSAVTASDPSHYYGGTPPSNQGCTPGYWKNHTGSWPPAGYSPSQAVDSVFANVNTYYPALGNATLLAALSFAGGAGGEGAAEILLRAAVAAMLNASHPGVAYPRTAAAVIADVNTALLQNRDAMLALAAALDAENNRGCPLN